LKCPCRSCHCHRRAACRRLALWSPRMTSRTTPSDHPAHLPVVPRPAPLTADRSTPPPTWIHTGAEWIHPKACELSRDYLSSSSSLKCGCHFTYARRNHRCSSRR
jgi:hypothetical protein